jgi:translation initiation factor IF-3
MGPRINERIRVREVRVVDDVDGQLGIMSPREALEIARERGLDLIEVAPNANPPVCRIMNYGKFKYEQGKREREAAKKQRQAAEIKGMTLRPGTDDHDLDFKIKNITKFLSEGDKVKVTVRFRSREMSHPEFAQAALNKIVNAVTEAGVGSVERHPIMEGRQMIMVLAPAREGATGPKKPAAPKASSASSASASSALAAEPAAASNSQSAPAPAADAAPAETAAPPPAAEAPTAA